MKNLLIVVLVLVVALGAVGYWRGWFTVGDGKMHTDAEKFKKDKAALVERAKKVGNKFASLFKSKETMTAEKKAKMEKELAEMDELKKEHDRLEANLKKMDEWGEDQFASKREALAKEMEGIEKKMDELATKLEKAKDKDK